MGKTGWDKTEFLKIDELDKYCWHKGFFPYHWDTKIWKRNFTELKLRDKAIFTLGPLENKKILDIGCGQEALYMLTFLKMGATYVAGQDILPEVVEQATTFCKDFESSSEGASASSKYEIKLGDCTSLQFPDNTFDLVFSGDVFEHITDEQKNQCISEIYRVLKPGGLVTVKTPNLDYLRLSVFIKRLNAVLRLRSPFKIHIAHTYNNPNNEHHGLTTYKTLKKLFQANTFHDALITHYRLDRKNFPLMISRLLEKNKYFNEHIIITARKPVFYGLYNK